MIVVEGARGTGKSTLTAQLSKELSIPARMPFGGHRGRGDFLLERIKEELNKWPDPSYGTGVYDTYPLINEWIEGPKHRSRISEGFLNFSIHPILDYFWEEAFIVYCRPDDDLIRDPSLPFYDFMLRLPLIGADVVEYNYMDPYGFSLIKSRAVTHRRLREGY